MDYSPQGSSVHGISQATTLEWVAISSSGDLLDSGIEPVSPALAGGFFTTEPPGKPLSVVLSHPFCDTVLQQPQETNASGSRDILSSP